MSCKVVSHWLQEFNYVLIDKSIWGQGDTSSSCHELPLESREKAVPSKHNIFTHLPKDRNYDICFMTKITRTSCRRRTDTVVPRAENFGDLITADDKVLSEECESRWNHQHAVMIQDVPTKWLQSYPRAVMVQDLNTKWIQSYPSRTKTSQETQRSGTKSQLHWQVLGIWQSLWRSFLESLYVNVAQIGNEWDCGKSNAQNEGRDICSTVAIRSGWKMTSGFHEKLLLSAKHSRFIVWWDDTPWKANRNTM